MILKTTPTELNVDFEGYEQLFAFRGSLHIPKDRIAHISWHEKFEDFGAMWRVGGVGAPGLLYAGYFRENHEWQFMYVKHPRGFFRTVAHSILKIETHDFRYHNIYLTVPKEQADDVVRWWHTRG